MIEENGRVVAVDDGAVWVETVRKAGCGRCDEPGGCGNGALARHARNRMGRVRALNPQSLLVNVGDYVLVGVPEDAVLRGALLVYVLPLLGLLLGAAAGDRFMPGDAGAVAGALAGVAVAFVCVRFAAQRAMRDPGTQPVIVRRLAAPVEASCPPS